MSTPFRWLAGRTGVCLLLSLALWGGKVRGDDAPADYFRGTPHNPLIQAMLDSVSTDSLSSYLHRLVGFHTRHTNSDTTSPDTGIGAARNWILGQFENFAAQTNGGLDADFFVFPATVCGEFNAFHKNVLATIRGNLTPARYFIASGHMDSRMEDNCNATAFAPGANDDGSGTVTSLELARIMSRFAGQFESTLILMCVTGEDQGLIGSSAYADWALANQLRIDGMITNDVVGGIVGCENPACPNGNFITDSTSVRHFSGGPATSSSRQLARYLKLKGEQYVTDVPWRVNLIPALDRPGRGGDHIPFFDNGYPAVRFTEAHENGDGTGNNGHQHNATDLVEFVNFNYLARVVKTNLAGLATLAMAPQTPPAPLVVEDLGTGTGVRLSWERANTEPDFAGYRIAWRHPDSLFYQEIIPVGDTTAYIVTGLSAEQPLYFCYSALDAAGNESVFSPEVLATPRVIPAVPQGLEATSTPTEVQLHWQPNAELDLSGYKIRRSDAAGNVEIFELGPGVTAFSDATLQPHVLYRYRVMATDSDGNESPASGEVFGQLATHDRGILVLDVSRDGPGNVQLPTDEAVDEYYLRLLEDFVVAGQWDLADSAAQLRPLSDADLGIYSTVVLHSDVRLRLRQVSEDTTALRKYLQNGGNLVLSGWQLLTSISGNGLAEKAFSPGEFVYDYLKVDSARSAATIDFRGATPAFGTIGYPPVAVDSAKYPIFGGNLNAMEAVLTLVGQPQTRPLYGYESATDPPSDLQGKIVAYRHHNDRYGVVVFIFPLYFMEEGAARAAITQSLRDLGEVTAISEPDAPPGTPTSLELAQNFPNPFNPATTIRYRLPQTGRVKLAIYNLLGQPVAILVDQKLPAGNYEVEWNGRDHTGAPVASGAYFYRLEMDHQVKIRKLVLVR